MLQGQQMAHFVPSRPLRRCARVHTASEVAVCAGAQTPRLAHPILPAMSAMPEPVLPPVADAAIEPETEAKLSLVTLGVAIMSAIAIVGALYLGRAFFVPLLLGILASYALAPLVDWLEGRRIPRAIGAALVLLLLVGMGTWTVVSRGDDAEALIASLPEAARQVRQHLKESRASSGPGSMEKIQEAATELQGAAADASEKPAARAKPPSREPEASSWIRDF